MTDENEKETDQKEKLIFKLLLENDNYTEKLKLNKQRIKQILSDNQEKKEAEKTKNLINDFDFKSDLKTSA